MIPIIRNELPHKIFLKKRSGAQGGISTDRLLTIYIDNWLTFPYTRVEKGFRVKAQDAWKILPYLRSRILDCRESALMNKQDHKRYYS